MRRTRGQLNANHPKVAEYQRVWGLWGPSHQASHPVGAHEEGPPCPTPDTPPPLAHTPLPPAGCSARRYKPVWKGTPRSHRPPPYNMLYTQPLPPAGCSARRYKLAWKGTPRSHCPPPTRRLQREAL